MWNILAGWAWVEQHLKLNRGENGTFNFIIPGEICVDYMQVKTKDKNDVKCEIEREKVGGENGKNDTNCEIEREKVEHVCRTKRVCGMRWK